MHKLIKEQLELWQPYTAIYFLLGALLTAILSPIGFVAMLFGVVLSSMGTFAWYIVEGSTTDLRYIKASTVGSLIALVIGAFLNLFV